MRSFLLSMVFSLLTSAAVLSQHNLAMYNANDATVYYLAKGTYSIPFFVTDMGPQFSSQVAYAYSVNNGPAVKQYATVDHNDASNCVNAITKSGYRISFMTPVNFLNVGTYALKVWIDSIDGTPDAVHSNDTLTRTFKVLNSVPSRKGLNEYAYHVSCGPCGEHGNAFNEFLMSNYDDNMVSVKLHVYSSGGAWGIFNCPEAREIDSTIDGISHPQMTFNRVSLMPYDNGMTYYPYPGFCPTDSNFIIRDMEFKNEMPTELSISNFNLNQSTGILQGQMNIKFADAMTLNGDVRLSCMLVEDSIWYYQASNGTQLIDSAYHRYVLRKIYGGPWGKPGLLPSSVIANQQISMAFSDTIPPNYNKSKLHLIPIIQRYTNNGDTREVLNVRRFRMSTLNAPSTIQGTENSHSLQLYPNPAWMSATVQSEHDHITSYTLYALDGRKVAQQHHLNAQRVVINTASLTPGMYLVEVLTTRGVKSLLKLEVQK